MKKVISIILAAIIVSSFALMAMGSNSNDSQSSGNNGEPTTEPTYISISAATLMDECDANIARTKNDYKNQYVDITGSFGSVDDDGTYFTLRSENFESTTIFCYIRSNETLKTQMFNYNEGDAVEIKGKITNIEDGLFGGTVSITVEAFV